MTSPNATGAEPSSRDEGTAADDQPKDTVRRGAPHPPAGQPGLDHETDIVEEAGEGSFPGSDPPSWSGAIAR